MYNVNNSCTIYVSYTGGDDSLNGLSPIKSGFDGPFKSLNAALGAVKDLRNVGDMRPIIIELVDDLYLDMPIDINVKNVTLEGNGHKIIGGIKLEDWKLDVFNNVSCYSAKLPNGEYDFTDLWVDGRRADATRYPKEGYLYTVDVEKNNPKDLLDGSKWFIANKTDFEGITGITDAIVNFYHLWVDEHSPIESYDCESGKLVMKYRSRLMLIDAEFDSSMSYYLTNVPNTFGKPNEWYFDKKSNKVYYLGNPSVAYVPTVEYLLKISADNVHIRNIVFNCTKGDYASNVVRENVSDEKYVESETEFFGSDPQSVAFASGAIIFEKAKRCDIENCKISNIGLHGIEIKKECKNIRIERNTITDLGAGGIKIYGARYNEEDSMTTSDCIIRNNEISYCGRRYAAGCGILANHTSYLEISYNNIHHTNYTGISVGWEWGYIKSSTYANTIRRNHIHHIGTGIMSDMGGIYLLGEQQGTVVSENRIHDVHSANYGGWGIYTDEGSGNITIENNVVFRTKSTSFNQHYGFNNIVRNNIFALGGGCVQISKKEFHNAVFFENNIYYTENENIFSVLRGVSTAASVEGRNNIFWNPKGKTEVIKGCSLKDWKEFTKHELGSIEVDPMFENPQEGDFRLKDDSPAIKLGFKPLRGFLATGQEELDEHYGK